ncbi:hypothetical protein VCEM1536_003103A, partial [Vibrio cholerae O1 str. EM-1536]
MGYETNKR